MIKLTGNVGKDGVDCPSLLSTEYYKYFNYSDLLIRD
jgi:hypothetical protein